MICFLGFFPLLLFCCCSPFWPNYSLNHSILMTQNLDFTIIDFKRVVGGSGSKSFGYIRGLPQWSGSYNSSNSLRASNHIWNYGYRFSVDLNSLSCKKKVCSKIIWDNHGSKRNRRTHTYIMNSSKLNLFFRFVYFVRPALVLRRLLESQIWRGLT